MMCQLAIQVDKVVHEAYSAWEWSGGIEFHLIKSVKKIPFLVFKGIMCSGLIQGRQGVGERMIDI